MLVGVLAGILRMILPDVAFALEGQEEKILTSRKYFEKGVELFKNAEYEKAIEKFKLSYDQVGPEALILEAPLILYNISLCLTIGWEKKRGNFILQAVS